MAGMPGALEATQSTSTLEERLHDIPMGPCTWRSSLGSFDVPTVPTIRDLYDLQVAIEYECLRQLSGVDLTHPQQHSDVNLLIQLAMKISTPICQSGHVDTALMCGVQLHSLIAVFSLLHYKGLHSLDPSLWDQLSRNIQAYFEKITFHPDTEKNRSLSDRLRHAPNAYLIQLTALYVSFWRRGDSFLASIVTPAFNILFAIASLVSSRICLNIIMTDDIFRLADSIITYSKFSKVWTISIISGKGHKQNTELFTLYRNTHDKQEVLIALP